jgi:N-acyl-D-amino-acid deacylase
VQIALSDPSPFATAAAFTEILALPREQRGELYVQEEWRQRAAKDLEKQWGPLLDAGTVAESKEHADLIDGATLGEMAAASDRSTLDVMVELALAENLETKFRVAVVNDDDEQIAELLQYPNLLLGLSDAGAHTSQLCDANYATWLLGYWWRTRGTITLEHAVWRLTGHPASVLGMPTRGRIAPGCHADLVAFDPETVGTGPTERIYDFPGGTDRLVASSVGIAHTWVNGEAIWTDGAPVSGVASGQLLRNRT